MKNCFPLYFLLLILAACGNQNSGSTILEGEIKGLGNDTLYLYGADRLYNHTDTIIVKKGKFLAKLSVDTLVETLLLFRDGTEYPVYLNKGDKIKIKGSSDALSSLNITGNNSNEDLTEFYEDIKDKKPSLKVLQEKAASFIKDHSNSLVSAYLLNHYFIQVAQPDLGRIKSLTAEMTGDLKDRPYMENLLNEIQSLETSPTRSNIPYFHLRNLEGKEISISKFNHQYVLIHFWASWDPNSRKANSIYRNIYKKEQNNKSFALLGISLDADKKEWRDAAKADTLKWEQVCDLAGWNSEIVKQLNIGNIPYNILIGPSGRIEGRNLDINTIQRKIVGQIKGLSQATDKSSANIKH